jgi:cytochrome P450
LPHKATENVYIGGFLIPKGASIQGCIIFKFFHELKTFLASLTSVTQNPEFFQNPIFSNRTRFLDEDGKFVNDIRVCIFSLGLQNCIGKQLALTGTIFIKIQIFICPNLIFFV